MKYTFATFSLESWSAFLILRISRRGHGGHDFSSEAGPITPVEDRRSSLMTSEALKSRSRKILAGMAKRNGISRWHSMTKAELVRALVRITQSKAPANRVARR